MREFGVHYSYLIRLAKQLRSKLLLRSRKRLQLQLQLQLRVLAAGAAITRKCGCIANTVASLVSVGRLVSVVLEKTLRVISIFSVISFIILSCNSAAMAAQGLSIQGRLLNANGTPNTNTSVQFKAQIRSSGAEDCLLYEETQTLNLSQDQGSFTINIGQGSRSAASVDGGNTLDQIFSNSKSISLTSAPAACANAATSYLPTSADTRVLELSYNDGSGWDAIPPVPLTWVPQAVYSQDAGKLAGVSSGQYLSVASGTTPTVLSGTDYGKLTALILGTNSDYVKVSDVPTCTAGQFLSGGLNGALSCQSVSGASGGTVTAVSSNNAYLSVATGTSTPVLTVNVGTASGTLAAGNDSRITGALQSGASAGGDLAGSYPNPTIASGVITNTQVAASAGIVDSKLATISTAGKVSGAAITSGAIGGSTSVSTSGAIATSSTITATGNITSSATLTGQNLSASGASVRTLAINNIGNETVVLQAPASITGTGSPATYSLTLPTSVGTDKQILTTDGTGVLSWSSATGASFSSQTAATFLAAPTGAAGVPSFRTIASSDLPTIADSQLSTISTAGKVSGGAITSGTIGGSTAINTSGDIVTAGKVGIGTTAPSQKLDIQSTASPMILLTDSTNARSAKFGVNDGYNAVIDAIGGNILMKRSGTTWMTIGAAGTSTVFDLGKVGVGVAAPTAALHLKAGTAGAGGAPLKFTSGTNLTAAEDGAMEYDGTSFYLTPSSGTRYTIPIISGGQISGSVSTINNSSGNITLNPIASTGSVQVTGGAAASSSATGALVVTGGAGVSGALYTGGAITSGGAITASGADIKTAASTAATALANYNSNSFILASNYWNSAASANDTWSIQNILGTGANPSSTLQFSHSGSSGTAQYAFLNGNVGIGTASPGSKLTVVSSDNAASTNIISTTSNNSVAGIGIGYNAIRELQTNLNLSIDANGTGNLLLQANTSGNVGIGTTSPAALNDTYQSQSGASTSSPTAILAISNPDTTDKNLTLLGFRPADSTGATKTAAYFGVSTGSRGVGNLNTDFVFITRNGSSAQIAERMRIDSSGKVGIGTTAPTAALHIPAGAAGAGGAPLKFTSGTNLTAAEAGAMEYDGTSFYLTPSSGTRYTIPIIASGQISGSVSTINNSSGNITLNPIASTGSVQVTGGAAASSSATGALVVTGGAGVSGALYTGGAITSGGSITASGADITTAASTAATSLANYNSNSFKLTSNYWNSAASANDTWSIQNILGTGANPTSTLQFSHSGSSGTSRYAFLNGNVGIGTTTPAAALDVNGGIDIGGVNGISCPPDSTDTCASVAIGKSALVNQSQLASTSFNNTAVGYQAIGSASLTTAATANTAVGFQALKSNTTGSVNTALGFRALSNSTTASNNMAIGSYALATEVVGGGNVAIGRNALFAATSGNNVGIGYVAGSTISSGANNTVIGYSVGSTTLTTGSSNILIGTSVGVDTPLSSTSNFLNIGNVIFATGMNGTLAAPAGKVGIGTTAPTAALHIPAGAAGAGGAPLKFTSGTNLTAAEAGAMEYDGTSFYLTPSSGTRYTIPIIASGQISGSVSTINNSSGNITLNPIASTGSVQVTGGAAASSSATGALVVTGGAGVSGALYTGGAITSGGSITASGADITTAASTAATSLANYNSNSFKLTSNYWNSAASANDTWSIQNILGTGANPTSTLQFSHSGSSGAAQYAFLNGKVGIGTASPNVTLDVQSGLAAGSFKLGADSTLTSRTNLTQQIARFVTPNYTNPNSGTNVWLMGASNDSVDNAIMFGGYNGTSSLYNATKISFITASGIANTTGSERMTITDTGKVGIGTATPSQALTVNGTIAPSSDNAGYIGNSGARWGTMWVADGGYNSNGATSSGGLLNINSYNGATAATNYAARILNNATNTTTESISKYGLYINNTGSFTGTTSTTTNNYSLYIANPTGAANNYSIYSAGGTNYFAGNVGIGVVAGSAPLVVNGSVRFYSSGQGDLNFNHSGLVSTISAASSVQLALGAGGGEALRINTSGAVGIGTTSPQANLHLNANGANAFLLGDSTNTTTLMSANNRAFFGYDSAGFATIQGSSSKGINFNVNASVFGSGTAMTIAAGGNVGIGTTNPSEKLDVQGGNINASGSVKAAGVTLTSDVRFKRDIQTLDRSLDKILHLRGVGYRWRTDEFPDRHFSDRYQIGVIAQEVEQVFPDLVETDRKGYKSVNYPALISPMIESTKELYGICRANEGQIAELTRSLASVKAENAIKDKKINELEKRLERLEQHF